MAPKPTTREKKYPSWKSISKLTLSHVVAKLLETGTADIPRIGIFNDQPEPFEEHPLTVNEEFDRRLTRYESLARHALFCHGVMAYVNELGMAELDTQLKARNLVTVWSDRIDTRTTKERSLATALVLENK
jgi:hypothetical protein